MCSGCHAEAQPLLELDGGEGQHSNADDEEPCLSPHGGGVKKPVEQRQVRKGDLGQPGCENAGDQPGVGEEAMENTVRVRLRQFSRSLPSSTTAALLSGVSPRGCRERGGNVPKSTRQSAAPHGMTLLVSPLSHKTKANAVRYEAA